jgi:hypothetical protein
VKVLFQRAEDDMAKRVTKKNQEATAVVSTLDDKVDTQCSAYKKAMYSRRVARDCVAGSDSVKRAQTLYLPMPEGFLIDETSPSFSTNTQQPGVPTPLGEMDVLARAHNESSFFQDAPFYNRNHAYMSYIQRARFPDVTAHTLKGLVGTATRKEAECKLPSKIAYLEERATSDGLDIYEFAGYCVSELLQVGNGAIAVEINTEKNELELVFYQAETNINWRMKNVNEVSMGVFYYSEDVQGDSFFETDKMDVGIVYRYDLDENKKERVFQDRYENKVRVASVVPNLQGTPFEEIPVVYIGSTKNTPEPQSAPILGIAEIALSIYRKDADLSQSEYMTCNPNLVITGSDDASGTPNLVGATVALKITNPMAKVYYTSTDTSGLDHVSNRIDKMFNEAIMYGASLVGSSKKSAEAFETVKARQNYQGATLIDIVRNVSKGVERALEMAAQISGADPDEVVFFMDEDFAELALSPQMLTAMIQAWTASGLSLRTLLENLKELGLIKDVDEEMKRIAHEGPFGAGGTEEDETKEKKTKKPQEKKEGPGAPMPPGGPKEE